MAPAARTVRPDAFRAIADPGRRRILDAVAGGERTVGELTELLGISQPAVTQHLQVLQAADLVVGRREGRFHYYRLRPDGLRDVQAWIRELEAFWSARLEALARHLDRKKAH